MNLRQRLKINTGAQIGLVVGFLLIGMAAAIAWRQGVSSLLGVEFVRASSEFSASMTSASFDFRPGAILLLLVPAAVGYVIARTVQGPPRAHALQQGS